ncbi:MAG: hypothetical protein AABY11_03245, partial [archaeon]
MTGIDATRKSLIIAGGVFLFTLAWTFFLNQLGLTPDTLLAGIADLDFIAFILSLPFVLFAVTFSLTLALISASADKDDRGRIYAATIIPSLLATAIGAFLFPSFAQWYPLALFYFGSIPLILETSRMKRLELKNFVFFRSSFAGAQRGLQVLSIGILVTLS